MCAGYRVHVGITNRMNCQPSMPTYGVYVQRQKSLMLAPAAEKTLVTKPLVRSYLHQGHSRTPGPLLVGSS